MAFRFAPKDVPAVKQMIGKIAETAKNDPDKIAETINGVVARIKELTIEGKPTKVVLSIRIDADIVEAFKASGKGWQARINEALRRYLKLDG